MNGIITIDGTDGCGKSSVVKILSEVFSMEAIKTPPKEFLSKLRPIIDSNSKQNLLSCFTYYISSVKYTDLLIKSLRSSGLKSPIILDRSIYSTQATHSAMATLYKEQSLLSKLITIANNEEDNLLKPTVAVFLDVNETERLKRVMRRDTSLNVPSDTDTSFAELTRHEFKKIIARLPQNGIKVMEIKTDAMLPETIALKIVSEFSYQILLEEDFSSNMVNSLRSILFNLLDAQKISEKTVKEVLYAQTLAHYLSAMEHLNEESIKQVDSIIGFYQLMQKYQSTDKNFDMLNADGYLKSNGFDANFISEALQNPDTLIKNILHDICVLLNPNNVSIRNKNLFTDTAKKILAPQLQNDINFKNKNKITN